MNERIRELAEHCDFYVGNEHHNKSHEEQQRLWVEKFAELIVRESINVVNNRYMGDNNREDFEVRRCVEDLKKHFGVES